MGQEPNYGGARAGELIYTSTILTWALGTLAASGYLRRNLLGIYFEALSVCRLEATSLILTLLQH